MAYHIKRRIPRIPVWEKCVWTVTRAAMVLCALYSFFIDHDVIMGLESVFALIFTCLWNFFQIFGNGSFIEKVPTTSQTMLTVLIFVGIVFGSYFNLFDHIPYFDIVMHVASGVICAVFGFDFACIVQGEERKIKPTLAAIFGLCFALGIAVGWEFYEFLMDTLHGTNLQLAVPDGHAGLVDTMTDMMANAAGGVAGMVFITVLRVRQWKRKG